MASKERKRNFVIIEDAGRRVVRSATQPEIKVGDQSIIGPFRSRRGALYAKNHEEITTVAEAERLSKAAFRGASNRNKFFAGVRRLMQQFGIDQILVFPALGTAAGYDKDGKGLFCFNSIKALGNDNVRDYDLT